MLDINGNTQPLSLLMGDMLEAPFDLSELDL